MEIVQDVRVNKILWHKNIFVIVSNGKRNVKHKRVVNTLTEEII